MIQKTFNFKTENYNYNYPEQCKGEFKDYRNGIVCCSPSLDLECYLNYIELLNMYRFKWVSYGYLDLGMMPLAMGPSFFHDNLVKVAVEKLADRNIELYSMPPVSLMYEKCNIPSNDLWVFREDAARLMSKPAEEISAVDFIRWCWK